MNSPRRHGCRRENRYYPDQLPSPGICPDLLPVLPLWFVLDGLSGRESKHNEQR